MNRYVWTTLFWVIALAFPQTTMAQEKNHIRVTGKIVESDNHQPVEFATIRIYNAKDELITGSISDHEGNFELESPEEEIYIKINFVGFDPLIIRDYSIQNKGIHFNEIALTMDSKSLNEVTVTGEKSSIEFKTDKRVFNVGQDLTSAGGSALDVLNNVPSVNVNIEGTVSLRGNSNVLILINGKPSVITEGNSLGTITAEMIEKVEVITNPSAKYDAEGTSGILNLVLKKEDRKGTNGAVTINTGYPHNHSLGLSLNRRTEKFNLFTQLGAGYRRFESEYSAYTIDKKVEDPSTFYTDGDGQKNEQFYNFVLGTDYQINPLNMLTLSGHFGYEIEDENALLEYRNVDSQNNVFEKSERQELTEGTNPKLEFQFNYEKQFERHKDQKFTLHASGSHFGKDKTSNFENRVIIGDASDSKQYNKTDFSEKEYNFMADYVHPFNENTTLEGGAKYLMETLINDYALFNWEEKQWKEDFNYTNEFEYKQYTTALYSTFDQKFGAFGIKAGLRMEHTQVNTLLRNTDTKKETAYNDWFPSAHASYKFNKGLSIQAGYSRRISRPRMWDVNPFFSIRDVYNIQTGNPDLKPEYTNAFEITGVSIWEGASLSTSLFHRRTSDAITNVIKLEDDRTISTKENVGNNYSTGLELNSKLSPAKWLSFMVDATFSSYNREGQFENTNFDFSSTAYSARLTTKLKLPADYDVEMRLRHNSDYEDIQNLYKARTTIDLGLRKKIMKGRGVIHLNVSDLTKSNRRTSISDQAGFYRFDERRRDGRRVILGFSYGFGKGEAMEFSGQKMF
ncbi:MAG: TonB-dependent receptor [Carboxylicivirga sp.]|nr:TonB-dependent receptor [Carboxylicivirga sp.]